MNQDIDRVEDQRKALPLKQPEPEVCLEKPWQDDVLNRKEVADRLTSVIRNQTLPFVISIHGEWGTGKTFMLKRRQKDLEKQGFKAIYFNAWEDDFCDDPLLAIIGQMWEHFERDKESKFEGIVEKIKKNAAPLLKANVNSLLARHLGVTVDTGTIEQDGIDLIDEYLHQTRTKETLKESLGEMAARVSKETNFPVVFIIDELDRCRPTFAIELLERVKHIFDVPNMVFVLGINRDELCKSLESVYGEIDADVYLRRFFDMEFNLPNVSTEEFARHLTRKLELGEFFTSLGSGYWRNSLAEEFHALNGYFPALWDRLNLSLRDIEYCVRLITLVGKEVQRGQTIHAVLLGLLITVRLKKATLYRRFVRGDCLGSEVMDYLDEVLPSQGMGRSTSHALNLMEVYLYLSDKRFGVSGSSESLALDQLKIVEKAQPLPIRRVLSKRTMEAGPARAKRLIELWERVVPDVYSVNLFEVTTMIDLYQDMVRR